MQTNLTLEIDLWVYRLYELTHAEVLVIDPNLGMSVEAYEKVSESGFAGFQDKYVFFDDLNRIN
jgi:hypothetical protein